MLLQQSTAMWLGNEGAQAEPMQQDAAEDVQEAEEEADELHAARPPYAFRMETAKLLLDLDATTAAAEEVGT